MTRKALDNLNSEFEESSSCSSSSSSSRIPIVRDQTNQNSEIDRSGQLSYFLRDSLPDLRDLCVNSFEFWAQNRDLSVRKTILAAR